MTAQADQSVSSAQPSAEVDINEIYVPPLDPLTQELRAHAARYAEQWSFDRPFYACRSGVDQSLLILGGSVGTDRRTCLRTGVIWAIPPATTLAVLDDDVTVMRHGRRLTTSRYHEGRTYYVGYARIKEGRLVRFWFSTFETDGPKDRWQETRKRHIRLSDSSDRGYVVVL